MRVKVRKTGNSYSVTVPKEVVKALNIREGQEMDVSTSFNIFSYSLVRPIPKEIDWSLYVTKDAVDVRDGMTPDEYIRSLRDYDREDIF